MHATLNKYNIILCITYCIVVTATYVDEFMAIEVIPAPPMLRLKINEPVLAFHA